MIKEKGLPVVHSPDDHHINAGRSSDLYVDSGRYMRGGRL